MGSSKDGSESSPGAAGSFATTHWSVVLQAGTAQSTQAGAALEQLCRTYWYPLYLYVRRCGYSPEDAEDLTQEFFAHLFAKNSIAGADRDKGRFRSFLLGALKHFLLDEKAKAQARKRGGGRVIISWERDYAEERFGQEPLDAQSPDRLFDRRWALTVLDQATRRLRDEYRARHDLPLFEQLKVFVVGDATAPTYTETAQTLGLSESAVKSAIFRLRRRYHELVREEVAQTVTNTDEVALELRHLMDVFSPITATDR
jgi:RNA polymerase sigma factor (sigma-70 family)